MENDTRWLCGEDEKNARNPIITHITTTNLASLVQSHSGGFLWVQALALRIDVTEMQCERNAYKVMVFFIVGGVGEAGKSLAHTPS